MNIPSHRKWIYNRLNPGRKGYTEEFLQGVEEFVAFARRHASDGKIRCPCSKHKNGTYMGVEDVKVDLYKRGFELGYWCCTSHGEVGGEATTSTPNNVASSSTSTFTVAEGDARYQVMILDATWQNFDIRDDSDPEYSLVCSRVQPLEHTGVCSRDCLSSTIC